MPRILFILLLVSFTLVSKAEVVISEIMFRPPGVVENPLQEWLELHNPGPVTVAIGGWQFSKGISFTIPPGTSIPAGGNLVVAADIAAFQAAHPQFAGQVVGGWTGRLSDSGEELQLDDSFGN